MSFKLPPLTDHPAYASALEVFQTLQARLAFVDVAINAPRQPVAVGVHDAIDALLADPSAVVAEAPQAVDRASLYRERTTVRAALQEAENRLNAARSIASRELLEKSGFRKEYTKRLMALNSAAVDLAKANANERELAEAVACAGYCGGPNYHALQRPGFATIDASAPYFDWVKEVQDDGYEIEPLMAPPKSSRNW